MTATLQTLLGDLKRETENLYRFIDAQSKRIDNLHFATSNKASKTLAPKVLATLQLAMHREGHFLRDETNRIVCRIDDINWKIRNLCCLDLSKEMDAIQLTEALKKEATKND